MCTKPRLLTCVALEQSAHPPHELIGVAATAVDWPSGAKLGCAVQSVAAVARIAGAAEMAALGGLAKTVLRFDCRIGSNKCVAV